MKPEPTADKEPEPATFRRSALSYCDVCDVSLPPTPTSSACSERANPENSACSALAKGVVLEMSVCSASTKRAVCLFLYLEGHLLNLRNPSLA